MTQAWGRRLFIAGAVVLILLGLVHSLSLFEKLAPANETERQLLDLMTNYKFNLMGSNRSMDNLLRGFSITFMVAMIGLGTADLAVCRERVAMVKRLALVSTLWLGTMTGISLAYFFAAPTAFLASAFLLFGVSCLMLKEDGPS